MPYVPSTPYLFFFNDTPTTEIYTLSLHDALPIFRPLRELGRSAQQLGRGDLTARVERSGDRKSTRLNSSHVSISYAVFCLKKKNELTKRFWCDYADNCAR